MGALAGVADVTFDCKTATVKMKPGGTMSSEAAEKALVGVGLGMKSFASGPPATSLVLRARVALPPTSSKVEEIEIEALAKALQGELASVSEVLVEKGGRITVRLKPDAKLEEAELTAAVGRHGLVTSDVERKEWPKTAAGYDVGLDAKSDAAKRAAARTAIEKIEVVVGVLERKDGALVVFTKEPCGNLEQRLREALRPSGVELSSVAPRE